MSELFPNSAKSRDDVLAAPTEANLREFFRDRIKEWRHPMFSGECFTVGAFSDFTARLDPKTAFGLLPSALAILKGWDGSEISETALCLLSDLATTSGTTEMPANVRDDWKYLEAFIQRNCLTESVYWSALKSWYRR